jgi:hypothetical protein
MKTDIINKLIEQNAIVSKLKDEAEEEFLANLKQLFADNPNLVQIRIHINNHEFADGDATSFSLYYEDVEVADTDANIFERNDYKSSDPDRNRSHPLVKAVFDLFDKYDVSDLYERIFGDEYDHYLEITRNNVSDYN